MRIRYCIALAALPMLGIPQQQGTTRFQTGSHVHMDAPSYLDELGRPSPKTLFECRRVDIIFTREQVRWVSLVGNKLILQNVKNMSGARGRAALYAVWQKGDGESPGNRRVVITNGFYGDAVVITSSKGWHNPDRPVGWRGDVYAIGTDIDGTVLTYKFGSTTRTIKVGELRKQFPGPRD